MLDFSLRLLRGSNCMPRESWIADLPVASEGRQSASVDPNRDSKPRPGWSSCRRPLRRSAQSGSPTILLLVLGESTGSQSLIIHRTYTALPGGAVRIAPQMPVQPYLASLWVTENRFSQASAPLATGVRIFRNGQGIFWPKNHPENEPRNGNQPFCARSHVCMDTTHTMRTELFLVKRNSLTHHDSRCKDRRRRRNSTFPSAFESPCRNCTKSRTRSRGRRAATGPISLNLSGPGRGANIRRLALCRPSSLARARESTPGGSPKSFKMSCTPLSPQFLKERPAP